jgi:hypothetical protein
MVDCTVTGSEHAAKISAALIVSADGQACALFYILKGKVAVASQLDNGRLRGTGEHSEFGFTEGGNMTTALFEAAFVTFIVKEIRRLVPDGWVLLTMDQYGSHINSYLALKYLADQQIFCYSPHSQSTFFTQALDQNILRSTKARYRQLLTAFTFENGGPPTKWQLPALVDRAWRECFEGERGRRVIQQAFRVVGLHPLNRNFVEAVQHLITYAAPTDDYMCVDRPEPAEGDVVELSLGEDFAQIFGSGVLLAGTHLHGHQLRDDECLLHVKSLKAGGEDQTGLLYQDALERHTTFGEALRASGVRGDYMGFVTVWPRARVRVHIQASGCLLFLRTYSLHAHKLLLACPHPTCCMPIIACPCLPIPCCTAPDGVAECPGRRADGWASARGKGGSGLEADSQEGRPADLLRGSRVHRGECWGCGEPPAFSRGLGELHGHHARGGQQCAGGGTRWEDGDGAAGVCDQQGGGAARSCPEGVPSDSH